MPAFAPVTLMAATSNGGPLPLPTVTLTPLRIDKGIAFWMNYNASSPSVATSLTASVIGPTKTSRLQKVRLKLNDPIAKKTADGLKDLPIVDHLNSSDVNFNFAESATIAERIRLINMTEAALGEFRESLLERGEMVY